jgi:hypothetical protein
MLNSQLLAISAMHNVSTSLFGQTGPAAHSWNFQTCAGKRGENSILEAQDEQLWLRSIPIGHSQTSIYNWSKMVVIIAKST